MNDKKFKEMTNLITKNREYVEYSDRVLCPKCGSDLLTICEDGISCVCCGFIIYLW